MSYPPPNVPPPSMNGGNYRPPPGHLPPFGVPPGIPLIPPPVAAVQAALAGITVPAGMSGISAPPVRHTFIAAPPALIAHPALFPPPSLRPPPLAPVTLPLPLPMQLMKLPPKPTPKGPSITVFVGNITERAPDKIIQQLLGKCGHVNSWKRIQGSDGKWQAFGFCEYSNPESAVKAIKVLHDYEICDKKLIVKVDAKTQEDLDSYFNKKKEFFDENKKSKEPPRAQSPLPPQNGDNSTETTDADTPAAAPASEDAPVEDDKEKKVEEKVEEVDEELEELKKSIEEFLQENEQSLNQDPELKFFKKKLDSKKGGDPNSDAGKDLSDMNLDENQTSIIHREIGKFRDTYKKADDDQGEDGSRDSRRDYKDKNSRRRFKDNNDNSSSRDRYKRDRSPYRRESSPVDHHEEFERNKSEEILAKKEANYQKRLRNWIRREERKERQFEKEEEDERLMKEEELEERAKLLKFLQDYDDDRDDLRHYKGRVFQKRLSDRQKEMQEDEQDRLEEEKELESLKEKFNENKGGVSSGASKEENKKTPASTASFASAAAAVVAQAAAASAAAAAAAASTGNGENGGKPMEETSKKIGFGGMKLNSGANTLEQNAGVAAAASAAAASASHASIASSDVAPSSSSAATKRKLLISDIFNQNDEDSRPSAPTRSRPPPASTFLEENADSNLSSGSKGISHEERKKRIKNLIDSIPTSKDELFAYVIDWEFLDDTLMQRRIKPWINKKISEYIGDDEPELLEFICSKLLNKTSAQSLLDDVTMVLDDEAQVFVVKLWRLLIYEIDAKKLGLSK